ncbi:MAG: vWA domain-containing protein [Armatimonadota bacterium]|jgi:Ca-activated chloride channel family protein
MEFAEPWWLLLLTLIPAVGWLLRRPGDVGSGGMSYPDVGALRRNMTPRLRAARALPWLTVIALTLLIVAMARPRQLQEIARVSAEGIDIMLALDISGSMRAQDFQGTSRFAGATEVLRRFIRGTEGDRLGLVVFAGKVFTQCPLTLDHEMLLRLLEDVEPGMIEDGTAIGMAIATSAARLEKSDAESRVIVLLTDGRNNAGAIDPATAAKAAGALGMKIYAVGVGTAEGTPAALGPGREVGIDEGALREIARLSGGQYFHAADPGTLENIYEQIRSLEKSRFETTEFRRYEELAGKLIVPAVLLLALQVLLSCTWLRKIP